MISLKSSEAQTKTSDAAPKQSKKKQTAKKSSKLSIIAGRAKKSAPEPNGKLAKQISKRFNEAKAGSDEKEFFQCAEEFKKGLNDFKWRYFDQLLSDDELIKCVQIAVTYAPHQLDIQKYALKSAQETVESTASSIEKYEKESKKLFGSPMGTKSELAEYLRSSRESKARYLEEIIPMYEQNVRTWKKRTPVFEKMGVTLIGKEAVEQGKKASWKILDFLEFKSDGSVSVKFGKEFFKDLEIEEANIVAIDEPQVQEKQGSSDMEARLEKLSALVEKKLITKAEFNKKRKEILSEL